MFKKLYMFSNVFSNTNVNKYTKKLMNIYNIRIVSKHCSLRCKKKETHRIAIE